MKNKHPTDTDIQKYLFEKKNTDTDISGHIDECKDCRLRVAHYRRLFEAVHMQQNPHFDFDLTGLVMKQLVEIKPEFSFGKFLVYFFLFIMAPVSVVLIYLFSTRLSGLLMGIAPFFIYLVVTAVITLLLFQCFDTYSQYKKRIDALNFN